MKTRKCISCKIQIKKTATLNPYLCRDCEREVKDMGLDRLNYFED